MMIRASLLLAFIVLLACPARCEETIMFISTNASTSDNTLSLLFQKSDAAYPGPPKGLVIKNDAVSGGVDMLFTMQGATTPVTVTNNATQTAIVVKPQESVPFTGTFKVLHYRSGGVATGAFRVIMVY